MLFFVTFIPRLSLTVRRLHDSGKSGKWAKLPYVSLISGIYLVLAMLTALASMGGGTFGQTFSIFANGASFILGNVDSVWNAIFASAAVLNAMGWDAVFAVLSELTPPVQRIDLQQTLSTARQGMKTDPTLIIFVIAAIAAPFVTAMLHLFFMISPTKPDRGLGSDAPMSFSSLRKQGDTSKNPFAGYKYLYEKTPEQDAAQKMRDKQEIRSLYRQRVLGNGAT